MGSSGFAIGATSTRSASYVFNFTVYLPISSHQKKALRKEINVAMSASTAILEPLEVPRNSFGKKEEQSSDEEIDEDSLHKESSATKHEMDFI